MTNRGVVAVPGASAGVHSRYWRVIGTSSTTADWNVVGRLSASMRVPMRSPVAVNQGVHMPHRFQRKQLATRVLAPGLVILLFCTAILAAIYRGVK
jgi:hypothetical protein